MSIDSSSQKPTLSFLACHHVILKIHYFLFFAALGIIYPISNLTLRSHGLSDTEISLSNVIVPFLVFAACPLVGLIADKSRRFLLTFNVLVFIVIVAFTLMFFLPHIKYHSMEGELNRLKQSEYVLDFCSSKAVVSKCSSRSNCGCSYQAFCKTGGLKFDFLMGNNSHFIEQTLTDDLKSKCGIKYRVPINDILLQNQTNFQNLSSMTCAITCSNPELCHGLRNDNQLFYVFLYAILYIITITIWSADSSLGASIGFASLPSPDLFGKQRVWGTIGFGLVALFSSRIYELFKSEYVYVVIFLIVAISTIAVTSFVPIHKNEKKTNEKKHPLNLSTLILLLKNVDVIIFLSMAFLWGMCYGCITPYLALFVDENAPCQSRSIIGWMYFIASVSEVIAFYFAKRVLNFFGPNGSTIVIFLAFALRFSGYYFLPQPFYYLPVETMHFFNFGILYVLIAQKADLIAPPGLSSTLQGVTHGVMHGLGCGIGLLVSSYIYIAINHRTLFLVFAILNLVAALFYSIYFILKSKKTSNKNVTVSEKINGGIDEDVHLNHEALPSLSIDGDKK